jgi:hypothetical protein
LAACAFTSSGYRSFFTFCADKNSAAFTNSINKDFGTNISIDAVRLSVFGG